MAELADGQLDLVHLIPVEELDGLVVGLEAVLRALQLVDGGEELVVVDIGELCGAAELDGLLACLDEGLAESRLVASRASS